MVLLLSVEKFKKRHEVRLHVRQIEHYRRIRTNNHQMKSAKLTY